MVGCGLKVKMGDYGRVAQSDGVRLWGDRRWFKLYLLGQI